MAEGVKLYSQESWRQVTQGGGVGMVQDNISAVVSGHFSNENELSTTYTGPVLYPAEPSC